MAEQSSEFRKALEQAKSELSNQFKDLMDAIQREQNVDRRILNEARASTDNEQQTARAVTSMGDKLQDLLSIQTTMLTELTNINSSIKRLGENNLVEAGGQSPMQQQQQTGGGALGWLMGGAAAVGATVASVFGGGTTGGGVGVTTGAGGVSGLTLGDITSLSGRYESRGDPSTIGYDPTGGTSYGEYQIASNTGTMGDFINWLSERDPEMASMFREAGPANTGGRGGAMPELWRRLTEEGRLGDLPREFVIETHYNPAYSRLSETDSSLGQMIGDSNALQQVLYSTSVQHGASGASRIFERVYREGMTVEELIRAVYGERGRRREDGQLAHFGSSPRNIQESVANRFTREMGDALALRQRELTETEITETPQQLEDGEDLFEINPLSETFVTDTLKTVIRNPADPEGTTLRNRDVRGQQGGERAHGGSYEGASSGFRIIATTLPEGMELGYNEIDGYVFYLEELADGSVASTDFLRYAEAGTIGSGRSAINFRRGDYATIPGARSSFEERAPNLASYGFDLPTQQQQIMIEETADLSGGDRSFVNPYYSEEAFGRIGAIEQYEAVQREILERYGRRDLPVETDTTTPTSVFGTPIPETATDATISGGEGDVEISGDSSGDTLTESPVFTDTTTLAGVMETSDFMTPEEEALAAELPSLLATPMNIAGTMTAAGMAANPEVQAALAEQEDATAAAGGGGGYGGGGAATPPTPEIEASIIGRFGWGENLIKYYGLQNIIRTNMLQ